AVGEVLVHGAEREVAELARGVGAEEVRAAVHGVHGLAGRGIARGAGRGRGVGAGEAVQRALEGAGGRAGAEGRVNHAPPSPLGSALGAPGRLSAPCGPMRSRAASFASARYLGSSPAKISSDAAR